MTYPKTVEEFNKLNYNIQGALWPRCKSCGHIAQDHNDNDCSNIKHAAQCPTCNTHNVKIPCPCKGYNGPQTVEELIEYLNKDNK